MPTRTYLTAPPGQEPLLERPGRSTSTPQERYTPALTPPVEPRVPGRFERVAVALTAFGALFLLGAGVLIAVLSTQTQDPSLFDPSLLDESEQPATPQIPGLPGEEGG